MKLSLADFISSRYGKSAVLGGLVTVIAVVGIVPYIALQLKAVASSLETILSEDKLFSSIPIIGDIALVVTLAMAAFAVLFGTRQTDATEHQHGLMLAVATESIVKLVAFLAAGAFVTFWMFTPVELIERAMKTPEAVRALHRRSVVPGGAVLVLGWVLMPLILFQMYAFILPAFAGASTAGTAASASASVSGFRVPHSITRQI